MLGIIVLLFSKLHAADNIDRINESLNGAYDLEIIEIGKYSGPYVEDGTNIEVDNILMLKVKNNGKEPIQYGEIVLLGKDVEDAVFKFSTLNPNQTIAVIESEKKLYKESKKYDSAIATRVAYFQTEPKLHDDKLEIQPLDGGLNITNISDKDINGDIMIYFKNYKEEQLLGGITYRGRIEGGLKAGEIRQIMSSNFTKDNTKVMFITIDGK